MNGFIFILVLVHSKYFTTFEDTLPSKLRSLNAVNAPVHSQYYSKIGYTSLSEIWHLTFKRA